MTSSLPLCALCKHQFEPIIEHQKFCSGTCARAVKDIDELGRVYAVLDDKLLAAWERRKGENNGQ